MVKTPNKDLFTWPIMKKEDVLEASDADLLDGQNKDIEFQIGICCISLVRFLTDHRKSVPLTVTTRMLDTHDVLLTLVPLMEKAPWVRRRKTPAGIVRELEEKKKVEEARRAKVR
jgi:zinc finger MYND domain-containing protein 10